LTIRIAITGGRQRSEVQQVQGVTNLAFLGHEPSLGRLRVGDQEVLLGLDGQLQGVGPAQGDRGYPNQASELVEFTPQGKFVGQFSIDPTQGGAFGLAVSNVGGVLRLVAVCAASALRDRGLPRCRGPAMAR